MIASNEIVMESRSSLIPATIEKLLSDSDLQSRLSGRVTHGNHHHVSERKPVTENLFMNRECNGSRSI
jgi:hypothetical protein